jgi:RAT1-interacting protein
MAALSDLLNPSDDITERPRKNRRLSLPDADPFTSTFTFESLEAYKRPTPIISQPTHITSFSYTSERKLLLLPTKRHNEALRWYREPPRGADLNRGAEQCIWRYEQREGLDSLLEWSIYV